MSEEESADMNQQIRNIISQNSQSIENKLKDKYIFEIYEMQKRYIEKKIKLSITFCKTFYGCNLEDIEGIINTLVNDNELLRSIIVKTNSNYEYHQSEYIYDFSIETIDINTFDLSIDEVRILALNEIKSYLMNYVPLENLMWTFLPIKIDDTTFEIVFGFDHIIFDIVSKTILSKKLQTYENDIKIGKKLCSSNETCYMDFLEDIEKNFSKLKVSQFKSSSFYSNFISACNKINENYPETVDTKSIIFSKPIAIKFRVSSELESNLNNINSGICLAYIIKICSMIFSQRFIPVKVLRSGRVFGNKVYNELFCDCHVSVPSLFDSYDKVNGKSVENQIFKIELEYMMKNKLHLGKMILSDKELNIKVGIKTPINYNFGGRISVEEEKELLGRIRQNRYNVRYPTLGYTVGDSIGIVLFHGIKKQTLEHIDRVFDCPICYEFID